ncbi:MAG: hypothetical protein RIQ81_1882 [Pseudomonadota bacterium]|jgi:hypothetical protein
MRVNFDNNFQRKVMVVSFEEPVTINSSRDVMELRAQWMAALKSWHSPYKALVDLQNLSVSPAAGEEEKVKESLSRMLKFLEGLFLRKAVAFGYDGSAGHDLLPFEFASSEEEARERVGLREAIARGAPGDFRSSIQFQNHFRQHTVEVAFAVPVIVSTAAEVEVLKSKLVNNLMQWHSKWNLLLDCANLEVAPEAREAFGRIEKVLRGFFMKEWVGYSPRGDAAQYPFKVFRARHNAVAQLEAEGLFSGDSAQCKSSAAPKKEQLK